MVKLIGSKRALVPLIVEIFKALRGVRPEVRRVMDAFSGSARVGHALKGAGFYVVAVDELRFAHVLADALVGTDALLYPAERITPLLRQAEALPPVGGWFAELYGRCAPFFSEENAMRIEAVRRWIDGFEDPKLRSVLLTALLLGADRVDATLGLQMAYLKTLPPRAKRPLRLPYPPLLPGGGEALLGDALEAVRGADGIQAFYLDPPYSAHSYLGNYHVWETLVAYDRPPVYGKAKKRLEVRERKSPFTLKTQAEEALRRLLAPLEGKAFLLSYSDEGLVPISRLWEMVASTGYALAVATPHRRYVGAKVGIHNPRGERVGRPGRAWNTEYLFLSVPWRSAIEGAREAVLALKSGGSFPHLRIPSWEELEENTSRSGAVPILSQKEGT